MTVMHSARSSLYFRQELFPVRQRSVHARSSKSWKGWFMDVLNEFPLVDEHGKRYREFGRGCREYAPTIVPAGTVICKHTEPEAVKPKKDCPFSNSLYPECKEGDCSFYANGKCKPGTATAGKRCPLPARLTCGDTCTMYKNGRCGLFPQQKGTKNERV